MSQKPYFEIQGLGGKKTLFGHLSVNGAKNSALKAMAASILFSGEVTLKNVPKTEDVFTMIEILKKLGAKVSWESNLKIDTSKINTTDIDKILGSNMRASVVLTGPLLSRFRKVTLPYPGGCVIGARPIDEFIQGYKKMGAETKEKDNQYFIENIDVSKNLKGNEITFGKITVGGTETLMMAAVLADGTTTLKNCAMEPEIVNVAEWLNSCGANITGAGTREITIRGNSGKLLVAKKEFVTIPDRIEAGSFIILGAMCAKELRVEKCNADHLNSLLEVMKKIGVNIEVEKGNDTTGDTIIVRNTEGGKIFSGGNIETGEYPGFPTDLQAPIVSLLSVCKGKSDVKENIFEGRFKYVEELKKLGAKIDINNDREVTIKGVNVLGGELGEMFISRRLSETEASRPRPRTRRDGLQAGDVVLREVNISPSSQLENTVDLTAPDIRAGFALVMAAIFANGKTTIRNVHLVDRGYEKLEERLKSIGVNIERK